MARKYTVKTQHLFDVHIFQAFFDILDLAVINAWILFKECSIGSKISKKLFFFFVNWPKNLLTKKGKTNETLMTNDKSPSNLKERKTCQIGYCKGNISNNTCTKCKTIVCVKRVSKSEYICTYVKDARNKCCFLKQNV